MGTLTQTTPEIQTLLDHTDSKGWANYDDGTYTVGSPLSITSAAGLVKLECDGTGPNTVISELPPGVSALWDTTNDKIIGIKSGDAFDVRADFKAKNDNISGQMDVIFDIGDPSGIPITSRSVTFPKGSNTEITFSIGIPLFSMATFIANGCKIYLQSITGNTLIYDISVFIKKDYDGIG